MPVEPATTTRLRRNTRKPLISVCVPVFNGEQYVRQCIESILSQSERDFEVLISDNCSTDRTLDICSEFSDRRIRILKSDRNVGSIENFNKCIRNASGELFMLLPVDDLLGEGCLERLSCAFIENPSVGIAFASSIQIDHLGRELGVRSVGPKSGIVKRDDAIRMIAENFNPIQHPMVRSQALFRTGSFNRRLGCFCDIHLWSRILFNGWDAYVVARPLSAIRRHKDQGQSLFRLNTKGNRERLSSHYGEVLTVEFLQRNHYNLLFLCFVRFFNRNARSLSVESAKMERAMIGNVIRSHLSNAYASIRHLNLRSFAAEMALFVRFVRLFGLACTLSSYFFAFSSVFRYSRWRTTRTSGGLPSKVDKSA